MSPCRAPRFHHRGPAVESLPHGEDGGCIRKRGFQGHYPDKRACWLVITITFCRIKDFFHDLINLRIDRSPSQRAKTQIGISSLVPRIRVRDGSEGTFNGFPPHHAATMRATASSVSYRRPKLPRCDPEPFSHGTWNRPPQRWLPHCCAAPSSISPDIHD